MSNFDAVRSKLARKDQPALRQARLAHAAARRRFAQATAAGNPSEKARAREAMKRWRTVALQIAEAVS